MKTFLKLSCAIIALVFFGCSPSANNGTHEMSFQQRRDFERSDNPVIEKKIDSLLSIMTLEEKIGQMTQLNLSAISTESQWGAGTDLSVKIVVDTAKLNPMINKYHIGSFLNGDAVKPEIWYTFYKTLQEYNMQHSRLKIPIVYGMDQLHGPNYLEGGTIFPHAINTAATFDNQVPADMGYVTSMEVADLGHLWLFGPVCDLARTPLWGRFYETLGESPYEASTMVTAYIHAVMNNPDIAPYKMTCTAKHFIAYSDPKSGWDRTPTDISMQTLYEMHVPAFRAAINAGVMAVMINSGEVNGEPVHSSHRLLTTLLRDELKFKGVCVTDWEDIIRLYRNHLTAKDEKDATYQAIMAGIDMSMTPYTTNFCDLTKQLVDEGKIPMERIDLAVSRILRMKYELGLFDHPYPRNDRFDRVGSAANKAKALNAARESIVLMKNNGVLPLDTVKTKSILVAGPVANLKSPLGGGWTLRWVTQDETLYPKDMLTPYTGIQKEFPNSKVTLASTAADIKSKAAGVNAIVMVVGEMPYSEGFGSINDISLPDDQVALVQAAQSTGKPVIMVIVAGRPRVITKIYDQCSAVLFAGLPGFQGGQAIGEILGGTVNPSAKMSFNYPAYVNRLVPHNHKPTEELLAHVIPNKIALVPFGNGLSYTTFQYSNLTLSDSVLHSDTDTLTATVTVTNTGKVAGKEAVLWFTFDEVASLTRPVEELKYYEKQLIEPGQSKTFTFKLVPEQQLWFPDDQDHHLLEDGYFRITVGDQKARFKLERGG